jgi:acyl-CoA synthetase (AMP-forming)/AMP-acid ligase II
LIGWGAPPKGWIPGEWLGFVPLILMVRRPSVTLRQAFFLGSVGGLGIGFVGFPWIAEMLVRFAGLPWALALVGLFFFSCWMAIPYGLFGLGLRWGPQRGAFSFIWPMALFAALMFLWPNLFPYTPLLGFAEYRALPGMELRIVDPETGLVLEDPSVPGEIAVRGATLMTGYYKMDRELYFDADGFFHTQDGGFFDAEGFLHWTGRLSNLIKTGGANVSPLEIENLTCQFPEVHIAAALGIPHPTLGEAIVLCVVRAQGAQIEEADILSRLRERLSAYKLPRKVLFPDADAIEYTANQKLQVEPLRTWAQAELSDGQVEIAGFVY